MGVINVTPDSFSDGGIRSSPDTAIADAIQMAADGADLLDIGGESTRPGAPEVTADEEWRRIGPVFEGLRGRLAVPLSVDTYKSVVAERALSAGASIVNDISALTYDPAMAGVAARHAAAVVLMHMRGRPDTMYHEAQYGDVVQEIIDELAARGRAAEAAGIRSERIIYDPGIGFAKRAPQSLAVLAGLARLHALGRPILSGPSRKSFLTAAIGDVPPSDRVWGTAAAVTASVLAGAHIVRVHDVKAMVQVAQTADAILTGASPAF